MSIMVGLATLYVPAAAWMRSLGHIDQVAALIGETPYAGRWLEWRKLFVKATQTALQGDLEEAAESFEQLVEWADSIAIDQDRMMVRATYARLIGQDHAGAANASRELYEWLLETGSGGLAAMWAEVLPPDASMGTPTLSRASSS